MEISLFFKGFIIGISIAAPVGPIGLLCIQRTLARGNVCGLVSGLGAASADAVYSFIAAFGLTFISNFLIEQSVWFGLVGGAFLCWLGIRAFLTKPAEQIISEYDNNHVGVYGTTFFLTLTNPMTILSFASIFAGLGMVNTDTHYASAGLMVIGVFMGSGLWWFILSRFTSMFRKKLTSEKLVWVNRISGIIIIIFGLYALLSIKTP
ncbi:LysE family translocator [Desulfonema magnum]|uniref:Amino acid exporter protein, LeuE-type n=1 Tax=Desulfonema magnum TaxID=45655 RepID=A0A975GM30_9BACT|nr:LysE family transporter [Desulfonema magnum]QTA86220.1 Amino acid exporter protein, LeuE-type [Desulfonema magnum]